MKLTNKTKEKFSLHKILSWRKGHEDLVEKHEKIDLDKQWRIAFMLMTFLGLSAITFEVYLFLQIDSNSIFTSVDHETVEVETLNISEIESTINHYQEKNRVFESLLNSRSRVIESETSGSNLNVEFSTSTEEQADEEDIPDDLEEEQEAL